jgi:hypothetical protein
MGTSGRENAVLDDNALAISLRGGTEQWIDGWSKVVLLWATAQVDDAFANQQMKIRRCHINPGRPDLLAIARMFSRQPPGSLQNRGQAALAKRRQMEHHKECANRLKFTPDGKFVFISDLGGRELVVVDTIARKELKRIALGGGAAGILMEPTGARAYVAVGSEDGVKVIDLKTMEAAGHIETGPGPDGLGWAIKE